MEKIQDGQSENQQLTEEEIKTIKKERKKQRKFITITCKEIHVLISNRGSRRAVTVHVKKMEEAVSLCERINLYLNKYTVAR